MSHLPPPPPGRDDVTVGELWRGFTQFRTDIHSDLSRIERKVDNIDTVPAAVYAADSKALRDRISALEATKDWAIKLVLGLIIVAMVGGVLVTSGATP